MTSGMLEQKSYAAIRIEKRADGVAIATLNRPEKLNAVERRPAPRARHALARRRRATASVRALVVTGAGRAFCAGGDFAAAARRSAAAARRRSRRAGASSTTCSSAASRSSRR